MLLAAGTATPTLSGPNPTPTAPNPNIALNKPVTSAGVPCNASQTADKAVDFNLSLGDDWCTGSKVKSIRIDLGQNYSIDQIVLYSAGFMNNEPAYYNTSDFAFAGSVDAITYTTIQSITGWTNSTWGQNFSSPSKPIARYIRLNVTKGAQPGQLNTARIYDIVIRGVPAP